ncbi:MAG: hypothetical protein COT92_02830 [Candidatus Doudnabacteria bacterium CG10_big_fil_rev_8_21_14_0_10_42_18]|uniref:Glycosyltransferase 2-like domain-containing protein n=1 Tax=Candidatus Doudnabacteria bacterium CG10_big_fil_rev_8_21_14_0_10_42_18 TaxID=1974552 RepID=A0A2H0VAK9_9BACT|nr:MAG: hypothetical protein COT92_02830 [Candidatus Doudnabacteria bacterium CG10_big_fil_rev_8_21_14_0_10_42_18]
MAKVVVNLLGWNHKALLKKCIDSVLAQTHKDFELVYMDNASKDGSAEFVRQNYPSINITVNETNLGYAGGHNKFFASCGADFLMVLNPDVQLLPDYLEEAVKAFKDEKVGAVMGKLLRLSPPSPALIRGRIKGDVIDSTGITINLFRRGRDRGQWEEDTGQYDNQTKIFGVNGAASIFRKSALDRVRVPKNFQFPIPNSQSNPKSKIINQKSGYEYFDEDFFAYWEDLDLSWRLNLSGYECRFASGAIAYHERNAGQSKGGYKKIFSFIKHHKQLSPNVKKWNWKNHLFCILKNDFELYKSLPFIFARELAMLFYILIFETATLAVLPEFFEQFPKMKKKRKFIKSRLFNAGH